MSDPGANNHQRPKLSTPFERTPHEEPAPSAGLAEPSSDGSPPAKRYRFSIKFLMLLTLVVAIATAGYNGMNVGGERRIWALFFTLVSPIVLLTVLSIAQRLLNRRR